MKLKKEIKKIIIDYALDNVTTVEAVNAIMELHNKKIKSIIDRLDDIVYAHLWGDYGLSTKEVYEGMTHYLKELNEMEGTRAKASSMQRRNQWEMEHPIENFKRKD